MSEVPLPSKLRVLAIIQARMQSTRLPGKVLADIGGQPMLARVIERLSRARLVDEIAVATSAAPADDPIAAFCKDRGVSFFRGSEGDVLDRFYQAARQFQPEAVLRITADCPLLDPAVVDKVVSRFLGGDCDYAGNVLRSTYPDGLDAEVFSFAALEQAWRDARQPSDREHVTTFIRRSPNFRLANVKHEPALSLASLRWTVDTPKDLEFVRRIYDGLGQSGACFGLDEILALLEKHPEMTDINEGSARNEGYYLSLAKEPPLPARQRKLERSQALLAEARKLIPTCSQTFSKAPTQFVQGVAPIFMARGDGSHVWDVDGNEYIDYPMALAAVVLGHNDREVTAAVVRQLQDGTAYSLPHPLEVEVARLLVKVFPCAEMVRFGKNGSDATSGAVRLARAYTGRDRIACCGYHGWQDWFIGTTTRSRGVPEAVGKLTEVFQYNDLESLKRIFADHPGEVAAVIMEPMGVIEPQPTFLQSVKNLAHEHGALLVFDEIVTGFRWAVGGAQEYFGVTPDLACFGKAMANGFPISALVGRREIMEICDEIFFSFTFGGETASLAAAKATIQKIGSEDVISHLWEQGQKLKEGYNVLARNFGVERQTACAGHAPRTVISFQDEQGVESLLLKSYFQQECLKRGILFSGGHNICFSHSDQDIDETLRVYRTALELLGKALVAGDLDRRLEGPPVQAVFRRA